MSQAPRFHRRTWNDAAPCAHKHFAACLCRCMSVRKHVQDACTPCSTQKSPAPFTALPDSAHMDASTCRYTDSEMKGTSAYLPLSQ